MKTLADTLGVARSNLVEQVHRPPRHGRPIAKRMTPGCCLWCESWSISDRPMGTGA